MSLKTSGKQDDTAADPRSGRSGSEPAQDDAASEDDARAGSPETTGSAETAPAGDAGAHASKETAAGEGYREAGASGDPASLATDESREDIEREIAHLNDRHLRLAAEFENYRKRVRNEQQETWTRAQADLVRSLVDSVDDLQRVALLDPETATVQDIVKGVDMVERKMLRALEDAGLEVLDPAGEDFDPRVMEAVMTATAASEKEDDTVDLVLQRGYLLKGQLVRPARVSVRKHG